MGVCIWPSICPEAQIFLGGKKPRPRCCQDLYGAKAGLRCFHPHSLHFLITKGFFKYVTLRNSAFGINIQIYIYKNLPLRCVQCRSCTTGWVFRCRVLPLISISPSLWPHCYFWIALHVSPDGKPHSPGGNKMD